MDVNKYLLAKLSRLAPLYYININKQFKSLNFPSLFRTFSLLLKYLRLCRRGEDDVKKYSQRLHALSRLKC